MNCLKCSEDMTVEEEKPSGVMLERVWACEGCGQVCTTLHRIEAEPVEMVWK